MIWRYHLVSSDRTIQGFDSLNDLIKYCDIHRGQYTEYIVSIPCIRYKHIELLPNLDDPVVRSGYYLDA
jgi:hypothetical protein